MKKFYFATLVIMAVALISTPSTASANLLSDSGFETGTGWSNWGDSNYVTDVKMSGGQSAHAWSWNYADGKFEQSVNVTGGVAYKASGYLKSAGLDTGSAWIQFQWDGAGTAIESAKLTTADTDWTYFETPWTVAPDGATTAMLGYVLVSPTSHSANDVYFDNASFDAQPVPEPASMLLLGSGLIGLFGFSRKKSAK